MSVYFRWRQSEFHSILGELGIGIDEIVNSQEKKLLVYRLYKADLETRRFIKAREDDEDRKANVAYFEYLERNLGESLRTFLRFGDQFKILKWIRSHAGDIGFWAIVFYASIWIISR